MSGMPAHMAHLPVDRRGLPVPWINSWGARDQVDRLRIGYDRNVGAVAAYYDDDRDGQPDFARQSMQRQRESMVKALCQVCAVKLDWPDLRLAVAQSTVQTIRLRTEVVAVTEPWLCPDCCDFATRVCPELIRRRRGDALAVAAVAGPDQFKFVMSTGWLEGRYEQTTKKAPVVMWVKLLLSADVQLHAVTR